MPVYGRDPLLRVHRDGYVALLLYPSCGIEVCWCVAGRVKRSVPVRVATESRVSSTITVPVLNDLMQVNAGNHQHR